MSSIRLTAIASLLMMATGTGVEAQASPPWLPTVPTVEVREDSTSKAAKMPPLSGPVIYRAAATTPRHMGQGPQNPTRVEVPRGLGAGWIILLGAALGVYVLYNAANCEGCMGIHPILGVGAVLLGIIVVSIIL